MACSSFNVFIAFLLILFVVEGCFAQKCKLSDISIKQSKTGRLVEGDSEFEVVISNNCACPQSDVRVRCLGFSTVKEVDPALFRSLGNGSNVCLINRGKPIVKGHPIKFTYAWKTPTDLIPEKSQVKKYARSICYRSRKMYLNHLGIA